jgi:hypothetical protein
METHHESVLAYAIPLEGHCGAGEGSFAQPDGGEFQQQHLQLVRSSDGVLGFAHLDAGDPGLDDTVGSTSSGLQKQNILFAHRQNQAIQPT